MRGMFHAPAEVAERSASQPSRLGGTWFGSKGSMLLGRFRLWSGHIWRIHAPPNQWCIGVGERSGSDIWSSCEDFCFVGIVQTGFALVVFVHDTCIQVICTNDVAL